MTGLYEEIKEIPRRARECLSNNQNLQLPTSVPYIGMGSSYYAPLTLYYCGAAIRPYIASEYYYYLQDESSQAVLISQSGESSETVWNLDKFDNVIAVTNDHGSSLARPAKQVVQLYSGDEAFSSTKSYVNTLVALYLGLGIDPSPAIDTLEEDFANIEAAAKDTAAAISDFISSNSVKGLYVVGSGPNHGTALQAALTLSETTKLTWVGMPVAQYDHGPKETADNTIVLVLNAHGKDEKRIESLKSNLKSNSNALVIQIESGLPEPISPIPLIAHTNWLMNYLADNLQVGDTFKLGGKVTTVDVADK